VIVLDMEDGRRANAGFVVSALSSAIQSWQEIRFVFAFIANNGCWRQADPLQE
jgi:hypothetical protein